MASGTKSKGASGPKGKGTGAKGKNVRAARSTSVVANKPKPWGTIIAVIAVLALAAGVFTYAAVQINEKNQWIVSEDNKDPSENIPDVVRVSYKGSQHVKPEQRVAYDQSPPFGGPHDAVWADCTGIVYPTAVRSENMVHALEHGTVWIAYNPDQVKDAALDKLKTKVEGQQYMMLSPYPGLDRPVSVQSWGHQLKVDSADDARIDDFVRSLRGNQYQTPEPGGRCDAADPTVFDVTKPPPFVAEAPGPDAVKMDGTGAIQESNEGQPQSSGAPVPTAPPAAPAPATSPPAPSQ